MYFKSSKLSKGKKAIGLLLFFCMSFFYTLTAQIDSTKQYSLAPVTVKATLFDTKDIQSPLALTVVSKNFIQRGQAQLSVNESLNSVPGLFAMNPNNFSQDLRVSIRGFGARASFGIRGVKILVDGIPESTPDGQAQVDNLSLGVLNSIEVIRGPASSLYGNASGGVISFTTEEPTPTPFVEARLLSGSYGLQQYQLKTGQQKGKFSYLLHGAYVQTDGYRVNSGMKNTLLNGKLGIQISETDKLSILLNYGNSPQADDPGGINLDQVENDRRSARDRNLLFQGGETVEQVRAGIVYDKILPKNGELQFKAYHTYRDFANRLPFEFGGIVELNRNFSGIGLHYKKASNLSGKPHRLRAGIEFENQSDDRQRFKNLEGIKGDQTLDQNEAFLNLGIFLVQELDFTEKLKFTAGVRYDLIRLKASDTFLGNGDQSGSSTLSRYSPMLGIVYTVGENASLYSNISSNFETPTRTELYNSPNGDGGFNPDLQAQESTNFEVGLKGIANGKVRYEIAVFKINVTNEILPFEVEAFPGRDFFQNAGSTNRFGTELSVNYNILKGLNAYWTYTYSDFTFKEFDNVGGNILPGIPKHANFIAFNYARANGFFASVQARFIGEVYATNNNTTKDKSYKVINLNLGYKQQFNKLEMEPFLGINNLLNETYNDNIRINAFGGRFYEPAPALNIYGGIKLRF